MKSNNIASAPTSSDTSSSDLGLGDMKRLQLRRILRGLEEVKGMGTSLITLMVPPTGSLPRVLAKLHDEYALSDQIKSRV